MIYLDNSATTKPINEALETEQFYSTERYFNPSAVYRGAIDAAADLSKARKTIAGVAGCLAEEIIFTSGGTESDNTAIFGAVKNKKGRLITSAGEHLAVFNCFNELKNRGFDVQYAKLNNDGSLDLKHFESLLTADTVFVSVIHASNETGAINDIAKISSLAKGVNPNCIIHSDGVQAYLKTDFSLKNSGADLYSVSGHKVHCQKGIGALYIKKGLKINPLIIGAPQEGGIRAGTENIPLICSFAKVSQVLSESFKERTVYLQILRDIFLNIVFKGIDGILNNSVCKSSLPNILSLSLEGIKSEILIQMLSDKGVFVGSGSACSSKQKVSRVMREMNVPQKYIEGTVRVSFSHLNTAEESEQAAHIFVSCVKNLRQLIGRR